MPKTCILFLNENPLPPVYTQGTIAGKELRLRSALPCIDEVHVVSRRGRSVYDPHNNKIGALEKKVIIHLLPSWPYYLAALPLFIWGVYYVLKLKPKTIEAESPIISGLAAVLLGKIFRIPVIVEVRASYEELIKSKLKWVPLTIKERTLHIVRNTVLHNAHAVISNSHMYHKQLNSIGIDSVVINPGIQYAPVTIKAPNHNHFTIGYLGRLEPEKGADLLLRAFSKIKNPDIRLEIAGDGSFKPYLKKLCVKLGLTNSVRFLGFIPTFQALKRWNVLVNTTTVKAPLEMVNAEAAYMSVPVICIGTDEYPETVVHNVTGLKVSKETLSQAIVDLYENSTLYKKLQSKGHQFALQRYSFNTQIQILQSLYQKLGMC